MENHIELLIGLGLFVASELIGLSKYQSNSIVQLVLAAALRAFPYEPKRKPPQGPLGGLLGRKDGRR